MRNAAAVWMLCAGLAGCAGNSPRDTACEVFSPAQIDLPTSQDERRIEQKSTGDPAPEGREQKC
ncbi:hypothetical protein TMS3_0101060 [Pseudomonas taeanensis MS-3]|jgi:hypothetical protein|uniref:Lipoprotein n=1 Tax=Pseudomonas taeanensis MS-3 TaxID=1395571 RepID=A0A0A1YN82_9PSED|nr:hypothetical protein [Pseudomonas taeanensis]KFX70561.1 hypothetical protein TMS3_0101060 [Pseudomonas taeanensis MS-3]